MKDKILLLFLMYLSLCHCDSNKICLSEQDILNVFNKTQSLEKNDVIDYNIIIILNHLYILIEKFDKQNKLVNDSYSLLQSFDKQNKLVNDSYSLLQSFDKQNKLINDSYSLLQSLTKQNTSVKLIECDNKSSTLYTLLQNFTRRCNSSINTIHEVNINEMKFNTNRLKRINIFSLVFLIFQFIFFIMLIALTVCTVKNNFNLLKK